LLLRDVSEVHAVINLLSYSSLVVFGKYNMIHTFLHTSTLKIEAGYSSEASATEPMSWRVKHPKKIINIDPTNCNVHIQLTNSISVLKHMKFEWGGTNWLAVPSYPSCLL
jgi:hypothetical protein